MTDLLSVFRINSNLLFAIGTGNTEAILIEQQYYLFTGTDTTDNVNSKLHKFHA